MRLAGPLANVLYAGYLMTYNLYTNEQALLTLVCVCILSSEAYFRLS